MITGSHVDFASHVASHALGTDWMDLFDIVIFFARKPSFFCDRLKYLIGEILKPPSLLCRRPFWKLNGGQEVEPFTGWDELDRDHFYSQVHSCSTRGL